MSEAWKSGLRRGFLMGAVGGAGAGVVEALRIAISGRLGLGPIGATALLFAGSVFGAAVGAMAPTLFCLFPRWANDRRANWPLIAGVSSWVGLYVAMFALTADSPLQGQPGPAALFGAVVALLLGLSLSRVAVGSERGRNLVYSLLALTAAGAVMTGRPESAGIRPSGAERPNLLLVTMTGARADRFVDHAIETAAYERLATEGASFRLAVSPSSNTAAANVATIAGLNPWQTREAERHSVAISTRRVGYSTGAFLSDYTLSQDPLLNDGFDTYDRDPSLIKGIGRLLPGRFFGALSGPSGRTSGRLAGNTVDRAISWLDRQPGAWFAWVQLDAGVAPYSPPPPFGERYYRGVDPGDPSNTTLRGVALPEVLAQAFSGVTDAGYIVAQYDGAVSYADAQVLRLLQWLDSSGRASSTLVVVVGDHGEGLGVSEAWFGHEDSSLDYAIRVPLVMRLPGRIPAGETVLTPVELADVSATILAYLGLDPLPGVEGISLQDTLEGRGVARTKARSWVPGAMASIRRPGAPYLFSVDGPDRVVLFPSEGDKGLWSVERLLLLKQAGAELVGVAPPVSLDASDLALLSELSPVPVAQPAP